MHSKYKITFCFFIRRTATHTHAQNVDFTDVSVFYWICILAHVSLVNVTTFHTSSDMKKILLYLCLRQIIKNKLKLNRHKQAICHIPGITKLSRRFYADWMLLLLLLCKYIFHLHMYVRMYIYMFSRF